MNKEPIHILFIEEASGLGRQMGGWLLEPWALGRFTLHIARDLPAGLGRLSSGSFEIVFLDFSSAGSRGMESFINVSQAAPEAAIIVVTGAQEEFLARESVQLGAADYLIEGQIEPVILERCLRHALAHRQLRAEVKRSHAELENRIRERTAVLQEVNERLQREVAESKRVEADTLASNRQLSAALNRLQTFQRPELPGRPAARPPVSLLHEIQAEILPICLSCEALRTEPGLLADGGRLQAELLTIERRARAVAALVEQSSEPPRAATPGAAGRAAEGSAAFAPLNILVVEDEELVREVIEIYLGEDHHRVTTARNGAEGFVKFQQERFDVVLTDRAMPEMNGEELARAIKRLNPAQPIILLTGFGESSGEEPEGIDLVVAKPFTIEMLRKAIAKTVPGRAFPARQAREASREL